MRILATAFITCFCSGLAAQSTFAPLNEEYYHRIDRYEIKAGKIYPQVFTGVKQYKRNQLVAFMDSVKADGFIESTCDEFNHQYLTIDSWEWSRDQRYQANRPILRYFYKSKTDFLHADTRDFDVHINPVLYTGLGRDSRRTESLFTNTRGVEVRGMVDKKIGFYTYLTDNQAILPQHVTDLQLQTLAIPHEGFWKGFKEGAGVDFLQARGYITFEATRHINLQVGHDRFFIGNGHRSMILSDNAPPALFLKGNVNVWKLNYFWLINRFTADVTGNASGLTANDRYPDKFMAFHHFSFNIGRKLNVGVFESVIFANDSTRQGRFDAAYANPIIFYRAIEQQNGSSDNVIIGADAKWNVFKGVQLYGQLTLDEFLLENVREGNGWWANKFGAQLGLKYIDAFGVSNLDLQGELNVARPYTYSHGSEFGSYSSYRQPIAHPLGANFREAIGVVRYQPVPRVTMTGKVMMIQIGRDTTGVNWGSNILKDNATRQQTYGNTLAQGVRNDILYGSFTVSCMIAHNLFVDLGYILRDSRSPVAQFATKSQVTSVALRFNIAQRHYEF